MDTRSELRTADLLVGRWIMEIAPNLWTWGTWRTWGLGRTWRDLEGLGGSLGDLGDLGVGEKFRLADFGATHAILRRSSRLWTQPKSCRPHARGLDFGPRSTHAKKRGSRIVRKCRGRADFGRGRDFFDPRNVAWVEQNLAPARFGPTLGPGQVWPRTDFEGALQNGLGP